MTSLQKSYAALLFDMDGTLLSSIAAAERVWSAWARRHGIDVARFGMRRRLVEKNGEISEIRHEHADGSLVERDGHVSISPAGTAWRSGPNPRRRFENVICSLGADPENARFRGEIDALPSAILICQLEFEPKPLVHDL